MKDEPAAVQRLSGVAIAGRAGAWEIEVAGGRIRALRPSTVAGDGLVLPMLTDIHVHLDKTFTAARMPERALSLHHAIEMMAADAQTWDEADLRARAGRALERAYAHGTARMRTHLDWEGAAPPPAWPVLRELAQDWRGRVDLELAALTPLDCFDVAGESIAREVAAQGGVLGAFVYRNDNIPAKLAQVFDLAERHGLALDFHVDEGLEPEAQGFDAIIAETARRGLSGRVLCGHACALSIRPADDVARLLDRAASAGIGLVVLPTCNAWLQDGAPGRTPRLRGLAPLHEARAAGVPVMIGSDNVRDGFYPFGDYDLFEAFRTAVPAAHLDPRAWLDAIAGIPAAWMGRDAGLREGGPADFIHIRAADLDDAVSRPRARREVWRGGRIITTNEEPT